MIFIETPDLAKSGEEQPLHARVVLKEVIQPKNL